MLRWEGGELSLDMAWKTLSFVKLGALVILFDTRLERLGIPGGETNLATKAAREGMVIPFLSKLEHPKVSIDQGNLSLV